MIKYFKTFWKNNNSPGINETNLNKVEDRLELLTDTFNESNVSDKASVAYVDSKDIGLQSQINAIVVGGTEVDPRLSQALVDVENVDWTSQSFKALQDSWQTRIKTIEPHLTANMPHLIQNNQTGKTYKYGYQISATGQPQLIYEEVI